MKRLIIATIAGIMSANFAMAQTDYASLDLQTLLEMSSNGDACATDAIGDCYYVGKGGAKIDEDVAMTYYKKALPGLERMAREGNPEAMNRLAGANTIAAVCGTVDYDKAFSLYTKAANMGHAAAQNNLGTCYQFGNGTSIDYDKAF